VRAAYKKHLKDEKKTLAEAEKAVAISNDILQVAAQQPDEDREETLRQECVFKATMFDLENQFRLYHGCDIGIHTYSYELRSLCQRALASDMPFNNDNITA
jgi:hypothetical protein